MIKASWPRRKGSCTSQKIHLQKDKATRTKQETGVTQKQDVPSGEPRGQKARFCPRMVLEQGWRVGRGMAGILKCVAGREGPAFQLTLYVSAYEEQGTLEFQQEEFYMSPQSSRQAHLVAVKPMV